MFSFGRDRPATVPPRPGPAADVDPTDVDQVADPASVAVLIGKLEKRSYDTYLARLEAHKRLSRRNVAWNTSLVSLATATTIASVGILVDRNMYGGGGEVLLVALSILALVISLVVTSVNYGARSRGMESSYKRIQQISLAVERLTGTTPAEEIPRRYVELQKEYDIAIESSENHLTADYHKVKARFSWAVVESKFVGLVPYVVLAVPTILLVPFVKWFVDRV